MTNVLTTTNDSTTAPTTVEPDGPSTHDETFFQLVGGLETPVDAVQRRALEWARLADRLRALGASITIGAPS